MITEIWGYSSAGRAPALHAGGQGFESLYLHHLFFENCTVKVVRQRNCLTDIQSKAKGIKAFVTLMKLN